jgi:hypothetical protein
MAKPDWIWWNGALLPGSNSHVSKLIADVRGV